MEMSHAYMRKTVQAMSECGWSVAEKEVAYGDEGGGDAGRGYLYVLSAGEDERIVLETVTHPQADERYYLEIEAYHGLRAFSFQLDSWKHFADRVEFKYYSHPETNVGLSFILALQRGAPLPGAKR